MWCFTYTNIYRFVFFLIYIYIYMKKKKRLSCRRIAYPYNLQNFLLHSIWILWPYMGPKYRQKLGHCLCTLPTTTVQFEPMNFSWEQTGLPPLSRSVVHINLVIQVLNKPNPINVYLRISINGEYSYRTNF